MKFLLFSIFIGLTYVTPSESREELRDLQKKHRAERHQENKKWKAMEEECKKKFPNAHDTKHADYDAHFNCREEVNSVREAFEDKQREETCSKLNIGCKDKDKK